MTFRGLLTFIVVFMWFQVLAAILISAAGIHWATAECAMVLLISFVAGNGFAIIAMLQVDDHAA